MTDRDAQQASGEGREPKRYRCHLYYDDGDSEAVMVLDDVGPWILDEDYDALAAENTRLRQQEQFLNEILKETQEQVAEQRKRLAEAYACIRDAYGIICGDTETTQGWEDRNAAPIKASREQT